MKVLSCLELLECETFLAFGIGGKGIVGGVNFCQIFWFNSLSRTGASLPQVGILETLSAEFLFEYFNAVLISILNYLKKQTNFCQHTLLHLLTLPCFLI